MKQYYVVSLIKNGILGGGLVANTEAITYHTGKITIPQEYRQIEMKYEDIQEVIQGWLFILPTVTLKLRNQKEYKFAMFFNRKRLINTLKNMGVKA